MKVLGIVIGGGKTKYMSRNIISIDITKYIASICVVAIHIYNTSSVERTAEFIFINGIARLAVPFFFCCTGYFIAQKGFEDRNIIISYMIKLLKVYFVWTLVYIPIEFIKMIGTDTLNIQYILKYLHSFIVEGSFLHLWYFPATIFAIGFIHILLKKTSLNYICIISVFLYIIGMLGDGYAKALSVFPEWAETIMQIYKMFFITTRNGLFFGVPFVVLGIVIFRNKNILSKINFYPWLIIGSLVVCVEAYLLGKFNISEDYNMIISILPVTIFLFCTLLKTPVPNILKNIKWRSYSSIIYGSHLLFYGILLAFIDLYNIEFLENKALQFIIVLVGAHTLSYLISHKKTIKCESVPS